MVAINRNIAVASNVGLFGESNVDMALTPTTNPLIFGFQGMLYDPASKRYFAGPRTYNPDLGRWDQQDPIGIAGGDINYYRAMRNNTLRYTDPSGTKGIPPGTTEFLSPSAGEAACTIAAAGIATSCTSGVAALGSAYLAGYVCGVIFKNPVPDTEQEKMLDLEAQIVNESAKYNPGFKPSPPPLDPNAGQPQYRPAN